MIKIITPDNQALERYRAGAADDARHAGAAQPRLREIQQRRTDTGEARRAAREVRVVVLVSEFDPAPDVLASVLTCCDMTTSPDGQPVPVEQAARRDT